MRRQWDCTRDICGSYRSVYNPVFNNHLCTLFLLKLCSIYEVTNKNVIVNKLITLIHSILFDIISGLQKYVFPQYPDLGDRVFRKMHKLAKAKTKYLGVTAFRQQCEIYLSVLDDALILEHYVKMYIANGCNVISGQSQPQTALSDEELLLINTNGLTDLLLICFRIGMANYVASAGRMDVGNTSLSADTFCPYVN